MPCTDKASQLFRNAGIQYAPGKASNAGGVAVSGLEIAQNKTRLKWTKERVDEKLREIMKEIHNQCKKYGTNGENSIDYFKGANIAGFEKVANAMLAFGPI